MFVCLHPGVTIERRPEVVRVRLRTRQLVFTRDLQIVAGVLYALQSPLTEVELAGLMSYDPQSLRPLVGLLWREDILIALPVASKEMAAFLARRHRSEPPATDLKITANAARLASAPVLADSSAFENLLAQRHSASRPGRTTVSQDALGRLLRLSYGRCGPSGSGNCSTPAAGGRPSLKAFVHYDVDGKLCTWAYDADHEALRGVSLADVAIRDLCNDQETVDLAGALVTFVYVRNANWSRYAGRGLDFALIEAGHAAQNLTLAAAETGIASRCIGSLSDARLRPICALSPDDLPVYAVALF